MWRIEFDPDSRLVSMRLRDHVSTAELLAMSIEHANALEATGGQRFKVLIDLRGLFPLEADAVTLMGVIKRVTSSVPGFERLVVLADSPTVALQQRRVRVTHSDSVGRELVTLDAEEARRYLK
jgi:hypothetical protein